MGGSSYRVWRTNFHTLCVWNRTVGATMKMWFERITIGRDQMGGVPCIRGLRIPVATVVKMLAARMTEEEILASYPDLVQDDIREALQFAATAVFERELPVLT